MDLKKEILKEHSKAQANKIVRFIGSDPTRFKKLVEVFIGGPYRVTQRAAWPLRYCAEDHPDLIKPHITQILNQLRKPDIHNAVKRNVLGILQFIQIPEKNYGLVTELCFRFLQDTKQPIAVRVFSMTVLGSLSSHLPELKREVKILIEDYLPYGSPGFTSRAKKVLKHINKV